MAQTTVNATNDSDPDEGGEGEGEDWTSSSGSDSDSDHDPENITTTTITRPTLPASAITTDPTIHTRLTSFFSSLAEQRANPSTTQRPEKIEIDSDSDSGFEEDDEVEGGGQRGQYIELDLALGVLSEKGSDDEGEEVGVGKGGIKVPGLGGGGGDSESDGDSGSGNEIGRGGLAELTNVAAGDNAGSSVSRRRKTKSQEQKRKIEELG